MGLTIPLYSYLYQINMQPWGLYIIIAIITTSVVDQRMNQNPPTFVLSFFSLSFLRRDKQWVNSTILDNYDLVERKKSSNTSAYIQTIILVLFIDKILFYIKMTYHIVAIYNIYVTTKQVFSKSTTPFQIKPYKNFKKGSKR